MRSIKILAKKEKADRRKNLYKEEVQSLKSEMVEFLR